MREKKKGENMQDVDKEGRGKRGTRECNIRGRKREERKQKKKNTRQPDKSRHRQTNTVTKDRCKHANIQDRQTNNEAKRKTERFKTLKQPGRKKLKKTSLPIKR